MPGAELVVGGWFASTAISKFINKADDYLGDNHSMHNKTKEMLNNLKNRLPEMQAILVEAEKQQIKNEGVTEWLERIKDAAYEGEDLLDDFEAKRIHQNFKNKSKVRKAAGSIAEGAKKLLLVDDDVSKLMVAVNNIEQLCNQSRTFLLLLQFDLDRKAKDLPSTNIEKMTPILLHGQPLFGRDSEIKSILSIILGYEIDSLSHETISLELVSEIESLEHDTDFIVMGDKIIFNRHMEFLGIGTRFHKLAKNMLDMMRQKLSRWIGKIEGNVVAEYLQNSLTITGPSASSDSGTEVEPESSQESSDRMKAASTVDAGSSSGVEGIEPSSSQGKAQKLLVEMGQTQTMGNYGRPFVIPIVGISGIGKTALAHTIYSHSQLKDHFVLKRWFYMSQESNVDMVMMAFVHIFHPHDPCEFTEKFITEITGKRILLVFDDVCNEVCSKLQNMFNLFSSVAFGSVILVTTLERQVADKLGTVDPITLNPLGWHYFLLLLEYYAFQNTNMTDEEKENPKLICELIGRRLPRLPLVAKIIGSLLRSDVDEDKWMRILHSPWISLSDDSIISILETCYMDLNPKLRQCVVLCSIFPPNYIIEKDRIIQMWIANNFIQAGSCDDSILEDIGRMWFDELVNRSFFLPTPWPSKYIMHSAIRELAVAVFSREGYIFDENPNPCLEGCFLLNEHLDTCIHGYSVHNSTLKIPDTTRHLTVIKNNLDLARGTHWNNKLRTLLFYGYCLVPSLNDSCSMLTETKKLRVLELSHPGKGVERHVNSICELSHLRFLDLSFTGITELPESLCSLCHLQVLDIRGCEFKKLPKNMNHLINLRHLYASNQTINLVYKIGKLTLLQELEEFWVSRLKGHTISELAEMNNIGGYLLIRGLCYVEHKAIALKARLKDKMRLRALSLIWEQDPTSSDLKNDLEVLNSLQPHSALEMLKIRYPGMSLPSWTLDLVNIRCIHLMCVHLEYLPPFGKLRHLETLLLDGLAIKHIGEELYGPDEVIFPALKVLKFIAMESWEVWLPAVGRDLLPRLEDLEIRDCSNLRETPFHSLKLFCLKKLKLSCCKRVLLEGSICDKPLPLLSSLYIKESCTVNLSYSFFERSVNLSYSNFPNLQTLSLEEVNVSFGENMQVLPNLKRLILNYSIIIWNAVPILPKLTEIKICFDEKNSPFHDDLKINVRELLFSSLPCLKILSLCCRVRQERKERKETRKTFVLVTPQSEGERNRQKITLSSPPISSAALFSSTLHPSLGVNPSMKFTLEDWFGKLPHLVELTIKNINVPELSFASLVSLKTLHFGVASRIEYIPENSMPPNLKELYIYEASNNLVLRCLRQKGEDWPKIKHIPYIRVNDITVQMD